MLEVLDRASANIRKDWVDHSSKFGESTVLAPTLVRPLAIPDQLAKPAKSTYIVAHNELLKHFLSQCMFHRNSTQRAINLLYSESDCTKHRSTIPIEPQSPLKMKCSTVAIRLNNKYLKLAWLLIPSNFNKAAYTLAMHWPVYHSHLYNRDEIVCRNCSRNLYNR